MFVLMTMFFFFFYATKTIPTVSLLQHYFKCPFIFSKYFQSFFFLICLLFSENKQKVLGNSVYKKENGIY